MRVDPPYPSFTLVMITANPSLRLPAYRSTHVGRYHPYPRGGVRRSEDTFVNPYVYTEGPSSGEPTQPRLQPTRRCGTDNDVSGLELDPPVVGVEYDEDGLRAMGLAVEPRRGKLAVTLNELLGVLRRSCSQLMFGVVSDLKISVERLK